MSSDFGGWIGKSSSLPPIPSNVLITLTTDPDVVRPQPLDPDDLEQISGFTCFIDYDDQVRRIVCRRYDVIGDMGYVGAICHSANGYRQFRADRIRVVSDALTGETLGDGAYFDRFSVTSRRERAPTWGLSASRKATLIAGLNVLAFIARCDGRWHYLETEPIENFVCTMWLRKEWEGNPPLEEIVNHSQRLTPDAETFFSGLAHYSNSSGSTSILRRAIAAVINADGVVAEEEFIRAMEVDDFFDGGDRAEFDRLKALAYESANS